MDENLETFSALISNILRVCSCVVFLLIVQGQLAPLFPEYFSHSYAVPVIPYLLCFLSFIIFIFCNTHLPRFLKKAVTEKAQAFYSDISTCSRPMLNVFIVVLAGITLFLELVVIRWETALFPILSLYKNYILLSCFCGIGLGYALSKAKSTLFLMAIPVLAICVLLITLLRYGLDSSLLLLLQAPQMHTGLLRFDIPATNEFVKVVLWGPQLVLLTILFLLNVIIFLPLSQLCGKIMEETEEALMSYGFNLLGSVLGVILLFVVSFFWGGPIIWFGLSVFSLLWLISYSNVKYGPPIIASLVLLVALSWPFEPSVLKIHSPYQLVQKATQENGLTWLLASGSYHQHVKDLSFDSDFRSEYHTGFAELAYINKNPLSNVLIIGSGVGNDVAAAIRSGAEYIDAVEIDPAIVHIGKTDHPEKPYDSDRVNTIIDDGRSFVRNRTSKKYDLIKYGLQDTTILLSHGTNVRFDTYLYTLEGISDAYKALKTGGVLSLPFMFPADTIIDNKIYSILSSLPDAGEPVVITISNDSKIKHLNFMVQKGGKLHIPPAYLHKHSLEDISSILKAESSNLVLELPTDNWPFFLMDNKSFPSNYIMSSILVLLLSTFVIRKTLKIKSFDANAAIFFLLGVGFMLIETKAISELSLIYGNTWHVIAIAIIGILLMAFLANLIVLKTKLRSTNYSYLGLVLTIFFGFVFVVSGSINLSFPGFKLFTVMLLTCPMFFSGIIFSQLIDKNKQVSQALAFNILGSMFGGLLEYSSMTLGFSSLYIIGIVIYVLAWAMTIYSVRPSIGR